MPAVTYGGPDVSVDESSPNSVKIAFGQEGAGGTNPVFSRLQLVNEYAR